MFLKAVAVFLLLTGSAMALFGVYFIALGYEAEGWGAVEGEVVSAVVEVDITMPTVTPGTGTRTQRQNAYYPSITYRWTVEGETYTGSRYRLGETHEKFSDKGEAVAAATAYRTGSPITVYYSVDHPDQAVLEPSLSVGVFVPLPLGMLFATLGWMLYRFGPALEVAAVAGKGSRPGGEGG